MASNEYNNTDTKFANDSKKIFHELTQKYTENDKEFLHYMNQLYGNALSAKGLNLLDPLYANFFHYNKTSMRGNVDLPRVSRTYCFFTRPELNFSYENINSIPFFKWLYSKRIGKMIMASLTDPEYFIYGPAALNSMSSTDIATIEAIIKEFQSVVAAEDLKLNKTDPDYNRDSTSSPANYTEEAAEEVTEDEAADVAALQSLDLNTLADDTQSIETLRNQITNVKQYYKSMSANDARLVQLNSKLQTAIGGNANDPYGDNGRTKYLQDKGLYQAKSIFCGQHDSFNDRFRFTTPFIPLLQNCCTQISGAKDFNLETFTYEEDEHGGKITIPTGMDEIWSGGSLSVSFEDVLYGPVSLMMMVWVLYIHYVSRGYISTTREHITERILDYTCSIYVFVIGDDGRRIERWCKYTGCYPTSFPLSSQLDHNNMVDPELLQKIQINFNYNRYEPMNPEIFTDFNFLSESEWLVKLKDPYWESLYNRAANINSINFLDIHGKQSDTERLLLRSLKRPEALWTTIDANQRGMSGMLPKALIEGTTTGMINNFWGGYPYINRGSEFVWVLPQFNSAEGITKDNFSNGVHDDYSSGETDSKGVSSRQADRAPLHYSTTASEVEPTQGAANQDVLLGKVSSANPEASHTPE